MSALTEWSFLAEIELPEGMRWVVFGGDPAIKEDNADTYFGWINGNVIPRSFYVLNKESQSDELYPEGTTLEQACRALANYAWCL